MMAVAVADRGSPSSPWVGLGGFLATATGLTLGLVQNVRTHKALDPRFAVVPTGRGLGLVARL
jgi:hypothetical protein